MPSVTPAEPNGIITAATEAGIRGFQRDNRLRQDGRINPGGPTVRKLGETLFGRKERAAPASSVPASPASLAQGPQSAEPAALGAGQARSAVKRDAKLPGFLGAGDANEIKRSVQNTRRSGQLDRIERIYRGYVSGGRRRGLDEAADNLEHFLDGSGKPRVFSREKARQFRPIRDAEVHNRGAFVNKTFLGKTDDNKELNERLKRLKDGQSTNFIDHWDRDYKTLDAAGRALTGDADFFLAFGRTKVRSDADLTATRKGNMVFFEGTVTHEWDDNYDFQPMQDLADGAIALQDDGRAKPFRFGANWTQRVRGTAEIRNGELTNPKAQWTDIEQ